MEKVILQPLVVLVAWTLIMWVWMYATRIPAIVNAKMKMDPCAPSGQQMSQLPPHVRWKADNYNHLLEQPTIFYAIVLAIAVTGGSSEYDIWAAWAYVGLRICHSLLQALVNKIEARFALFVLSNVPLIWLVVSAFSQIF